LPIPLDSVRADQLRQHISRRSIDSPWYFQGALKPSRTLSCLCNKLSDFITTRSWLIVAAMAASAQAECPCKNQPLEANNHPACFRHVQGSTSPDAFNRAKILLSKLESSKSQSFPSGGQKPKRLAAPRQISLEQQSLLESPEQSMNR
jgi:hypothetical protein